jgi:hypothetical protein
VPTGGSESSQQQQQQQQADHDETNDSNNQPVILGASENIWAIGDSNSQSPIRRKATAVETKLGIGINLGLMTLLRITECRQFKAPVGTVPNNN